MTTHSITDFELSPELREKIARRAEERGSSPVALLEEIFADGDWELSLEQEAELKRRMDDMDSGRSKPVSEDVVLAMLDEHEAAHDSAA